MIPRTQREPNVLARPATFRTAEGAHFVELGARFARNFKVLALVAQRVLFTSAS